jgi:hypothetical protein
MRNDGIQAHVKNTSITKVTKGLHCLTCVTVATHDWLII